MFLLSPFYILYTIQYILQQFAETFKEELVKATYETNDVRLSNEGRKQRTTTKNDAVHIYIK